MSENNKIVNWIIPCDSTAYDVNGAFNRFDKLYWRQSTNIHVGDIIYIYVSGKVRRICYQCEVLDVECSNEVASSIDDSDFFLDRSNYIQYKRYMLLRLKKRLSQANLTLNDLRDNGLSGNIQGPQKVHDKLLEYITKEASKSINILPSMKKYLLKDNIEDRLDDNNVDSI